MFSSAKYLYERIDKADRLARSASHRTSMTVEDERIDHGRYQASICLSGDFGMDPDLHPRGVEKLEAEQELGFHVLWIPLIGIPLHRFLKRFQTAHQAATVDESLAYGDRFSQTCTVIESHAGGRVQYDRMIARHTRPDEPAILTLKRIHQDHLFNADQQREFATAIAERNDGESVAAHVACGLGIFATRDTNKNRTDTTFGSACLKDLSNQFGLKVTTPSTDTYDGLVL